MTLYFIALLLPKSLENKIQELKLEVAEKYEAKHALKLPAHITLQIPFRMETAQEKELIQLLESFSEVQEKFPVKLNDFGRFGQKVIFINIENHALFIDLHANLQETLNDFKQFNQREKFSKIHPHISLATRDLNYKQFPAAWADFKTRNFNAEFSACKLCLFKHDGKTWHILQEFELQK